MATTKFPTIESKTCKKIYEEMKAKEDLKILKVIRREIIKCSKQVKVLKKKTITGEARTDGSKKNNKINEIESICGQNWIGKLTINFSKEIKKRKELEDGIKSRNTKFHEEK